MTISPIPSGRITNQLIAKRFQRHVEDAHSSLANLQEQLSTGQRYQLPSEAPASSVRAMIFQRIIERKDQMQISLNTGRSLLAASDDALRPVGDALNRAKSLLFAGIGSGSTATEKQGLAIEVDSLVRDVLNSANRQFRDRYLFGGSETQQVPFDLQADGSVRYGGDVLSIQSFFDIDLRMANNIDGNSAFVALTEPVGDDINPALTLATRLEDANGGLGVPTGSITVTLDNGSSTQTQTVDLSSAQTFDDVKTQLENAFAAGPLTLTAEIDPTTNFGLRLTPSAGTVGVSDIGGGTTARDLGIESGATGVINGSDIDPILTIHTPLSTLNAGTGIGTIAGNGLQIVNGNTTSTVNIPSAADATIEDLFNAMHAVDKNLFLAINEDRNGLAVSSRFSGADFSIGENNGQNATLLGIRTMTASTSLSELNFGVGASVNDGINLEITRRDTSTASIDLSGTFTVQQVLDRINAVDPGVLTAALNSVGNGITIDDVSGDITIADNALATSLGIAGTQPAGTAITGSDVNSRQTEGVLNVLIGIAQALRAGDDVELARLGGELDAEIDRFNLVRAEVGARLREVDNVEARLQDEDVQIRASLSLEFDTDFAETITRIATYQTTLEATFRTASQSLQLNLFSYL
ncbi:MAG: hypothetical protein O3A00_23950 [Planctomycetota bacterium]|nr:hypothetical protein [Planctomycetota bacterium]